MHINKFHMAKFKIKVTVKSAHLTEMKFLPPALFKRYSTGVIFLE